MSPDPIQTLRRRDRREWRRRERRIVRQHHDTLLRQVQQLAAAGLPVTAISMKRAHPVTLLSLSLAGWQVGLAASAITGAAAETMARGGRFRLTGAGRYGRFWWVQLRDEKDQLAALLATHLCLQGPERRSGRVTSGPAGIFDVR